MKNLKKLRQPLPLEAIKPINSFLSSINHAYVIERLNDVFGLGGWYFEWSIHREEDNYIVVVGQIGIPASDPGASTSTYPTTRWWTPKQFGASKIDRSHRDIGWAYKAAVTDCFSKCSSFLEIGSSVWKGNLETEAPEKTTKTPKNFSKKINS